MNTANRTILVIDDNRAIHEDFRKILAPEPEGNADLESLEDALFGDCHASPRDDGFDLTSAFQGPDGLAAVERAVEEGKPFALAFVDVRMPPGWDGVETISRIWRIAPNLQIVICTAYSDYSWDSIVQKLGKTDRLLILRKPFDPVEVQQLAFSLTEKWAKENAA